MNSERSLEALLELPELEFALVSRDGTWAAWTWYRTGPAADVYAAPTDGSGPPVRLTETAHDTILVSWTPDSRSRAGLPGPGRRRTRPALPRGPGPAGCPASPDRAIARLFPAGRATAPQRSLADLWRQLGTMQLAGRSSRPGSTATTWRPASGSLWPGRSEAATTSPG